MEKQGRDGKERKTSRQTETKNENKKKRKKTA